MDFSFSLTEGVCRYGEERKTEKPPKATAKKKKDPANAVLIYIL